MCESLVRTSLIVEPYELGDEASEMLLREDEDVVQELTSQRADEPFGEGIRVRRMDRRTHDTRADPGEDADESGTEFRGTALLSFWLSHHALTRPLGGAMPPRRGSGLPALPQTSACPEQRGNP